MKRNNDTQHGCHASDWMQADISVDRFPHAGETTEPSEDDPVILVTYAT